MLDNDKKLTFINIKESSSAFSNINIVYKTQTKNYPIKEEIRSHESKYNNTYNLVKSISALSNKLYILYYEELLFLSYYFYTDSTKPHSHLIIINLFLIVQTNQELSLIHTNLNLSITKRNLNYSQDLTLDYLRNIYSEDGPPENN